MFVVRAVLPGPDGKRDLGWLTERTKSCFSEKARGIECVDERSGRIVGMVAYDQLTKNACTMHLALDCSIVIRRLLFHAFEYPFLELGKGLVVAGVNSLNRKSLTLLGRLGFREMYRVHDYIERGIDMVWFEMRREECRYLRRV